MPDQLRQANGRNRVYYRVCYERLGQMRILIKTDFQTEPTAKKVTL